MNYERAYFGLMLKASARDTVEGYTELHHWYPKSIYPEYAKDEWNLVRLTAREHFVAHWLLHKMLPNSYEMGFAFSKMRYHQTDNRYFSPKGYEAAKKANAKAASILTTKRNLENNPMSNPENRLYGHRNPMFGKKHTQEALDACVKVKPIMLLKDGVVIEEYISPSEAAEYYNLDRNALGKIARGIYKTHKGYSAAYVSESITLGEYNEVRKQYAN